MHTFTEDDENEILVNQCIFVHIIMLSYTLHKMMTSVVLYCALCWNTAIRKLLSKHCMRSLVGFCLHMCFHYSIPFLQRMQHSGEQTNAVHQHYPKTLLD